mgnify:CR=1 FL=1
MADFAGAAPSSIDCHPYQPSTTVIIPMIAQTIFLPPEFSSSNSNSSSPSSTVGVGGTLTQLQNFAVAGGTGNYIETSDLSSLNAAMDAIVEGVLSCKIALDPPPAVVAELADLPAPGGEGLGTHRACGDRASSSKTP